MTEALILGDGAALSVKSAGKKPDLHLRTVGKNRNLRLQADVFRTNLWRDPSDRLDDLLRLAAFVYGADTRISRGTGKDVFASKWSRTFRMVLPVSDLGFWKQQEVKQALVETLHFLTGDEFHFEFVKGPSHKPAQGIFQFKEPIGQLQSVNVVTLFSGGLDSLAAVLLALKDKKMPLLVSHRPGPVIDHRQKNLVDELRRRFPAWVFPHVSMWVNRQTGNRTIEFTQRSRSFLFTALGVVTAATLGINDIWLCDNGVVSINLPQSSENVGTFLSRSTHPRYLALAQNLMRLVTEQEQLSITNKLIDKTKKEVMEVIAGNGHPELIQEAVSCSHVEGKTSHQPHCGVCTQCIDRRFASAAACLSEHDLVSRYEKDIFVSPLSEGLQRTHAENYVRFATRLEGIQTPDGLFEAFPELYDCLPENGDVEESGKTIFELFRRHQQAVNGVLENRIQLHSQDIRRASLPLECLIRLVVSGHHTKDRRISYIDRLRSLLTKSIPAAFQTQSAKNERHVQDVGEAIFQAAREQLQREAPQIPFGAVTTKPDFSDAPKGSTPLFIEFKYVKSRARLNHIQTEMTSRVTIYRDQGAWILFIVYDPKRTITNDEAFAKDFEKHDGVWVGTVH
jgi:7-cyano-7-deazaguanine synthase in queuosine biosynthesis